MVFNIEGEKWTLDLRTGNGKAYKGSPKNDEKPDLTLTITDENFVKLVMGKLGPQQASRDISSPREVEGWASQIALVFLVYLLEFCFVGIPYTKTENQWQYGAGTEAAAYSRCGCAQSQALTVTAVHVELCDLYAVFCLHSVVLAVCLSVS